MFIGSINTIITKNTNITFLLSKEMEIQNTNLSYDLFFRSMRRNEKDFIDPSAHFTDSFLKIISEKNNREGKFQQDFLLP